MKTSIDVSSRAEGQTIKCALADPTTRSFVLVMGALLPLKSDRARERVLRFVDDQLAENDATYRSVFRGDAA